MYADILNVCDISQIVNRILGSARWFHTKM